MIQRQGGEETLVDIISEGGVFQGDSASGVYFNATLRQVTTGSVKTNERVSTNDPRAKAKPDAYKIEASPKKRGVCSVQSTLKTEDNYNIPITDGLKIYK